MAAPCSTDIQLAESPRLTWRALRALPYRLCSPPPAVGKARSCGVTPIFQVKLEDVLDNKHLPPLSLRDFEQHMLFVTGRPEYLYFVLWLKEYTRRYDAWSSDMKRHSKPSFKTSAGDYRAHGASPASPALASFFSRAQHIFLIPGSEYELDAPPDVLSPLASCHNSQGVWTSRHGPHPDPAVFTELSLIAHQRLKIALDHCVVAAYTNVGNGRALCGLVGGAAMILVGTVAPLTLNFTHHINRWERLVSIPGFLLGLTVIIAAWNGVCMMIWIFGDIRQLRRFEMTSTHEKMVTPFSEFRLPDYDLNPSASVDTVAPPPPALIRPAKLALSCRYHPTLPTIKQAADTPSVYALPDLVHRDSFSTSSTSPSPISPAHPRFPPGFSSSQVHIRSTHSTCPRTISPESLHHTAVSDSLACGGLVSSRSSVYSDDSDGSAFSGELPPIEISEAYYDEMIPEPVHGSGFIPRAIAIPVAVSVMQTLKQNADAELSRGNPPPVPRLSPQFQTATFIRPYTFPSATTSLDLEQGPTPQTEAQLPFDFEGLPRRAVNQNDATKRMSIPDGVPLGDAQTGFASSARRSSVASVISSSAPSSFLPVRDLSAVYQGAGITSQNLPAVVTDAKDASAISARMRDMLSVPAFSSPLTQVLNPVVTRAQWEIVVRSAAIALLLTIMAEATLLALPIPH